MNRFSSLAGPDVREDALRKLAGLLVGLGLFLVFVRKSDAALGDAWGDWGLFVVLLVAFAFLYGGGLIARRRGWIDADAPRGTVGIRSWEGVYLVFGLLVAPLLFGQLVEALDGDAGAPLNVAWIFFVTAVLAIVAARHGLRYGLLIAAIAVIVSWSGLWSEILSDGIGDNLGTYRGLLLIIAALLLAAAFGVWRSGELRGPDRDDGPAHDLVTGAAIAAVLAGAISFTAVFAQLSPFLQLPSADSTFFWELVLLLASLAAIVYGARFGVRGPAYVGAIGLLLFVTIAGGDLDDSSPENKIVGWPLALIVLGLAALAATVAPGARSRLGARPGGTAPAGDEGRDAG